MPVRSHYRPVATFFLVALCTSVFWYCFGDYGLSSSSLATITLIVSFAAAAAVAAVPKYSTGIHVAFVATAILVSLIALNRYWYDFLASLNLSAEARFWTHAGPGGSVLGSLPCVIALVLVGKLVFQMSLRDQWGGRLRMTILDWKVGLPIAIGLSLIILSGAAFYAGVPLHWSFDLRRDAVNCFSNLYEEILCRGLLLQLIARYWGRIPAMAWTSVLFGLMHGMSEKAIFLALTSWVFAWAVLRTESLWSAWIIHQVSDSLVDPLLL